MSVHFFSRYVYVMNTLVAVDSIFLTIIIWELFSTLRRQTPSCLLEGIVSKLRMRTISVQSDIWWITIVYTRLRVRFPFEKTWCFCNTYTVRNQDLNKLLEVATLSPLLVLTTTTSIISSGANRFYLLGEAGGSFFPKKNLSLIHILLHKSSNLWVGV